MLKTTMLCGLMCVAVNSLAGTPPANSKITTAMIANVRSECEALPAPDIPEYATAAYGSAVYKAATYEIFLENNFSPDELREFDPELIALLQKLYKPEYYSFAENALKSEMKQDMSEVVGALGGKPDIVYFQKATSCASLNAYTKKWSSENVYVKYTFQQTLDQADYEANPAHKAAEKARIKQAKATEQVSVQKVQDDTSKRVNSKSGSTTTQKMVEPTDPNGQFLVGMNYEMGKDGTHNPQEAMIWFRKSAEQGNGRAQYFLGSHYLMGDGVPVDKVQAYVWFSVSAANGYYPATQARDVYGLNLSESQRTAAQELAKQYFEKYQPKNR